MITLPRLLQGGLVLILVVAATLLLLRLLDHSKKDLLAYRFASPLGRRAIVTFNATLIALVIVLAWWALGGIEATEKNATRQSLQTVLEVTREALNIWVADQKHLTELVAAEPRIIAIAAQQLTRYEEGADLLSSRDLSGVEELLSKVYQRSVNTDFFIIALDRAVVVSKRDDDVGRTRASFFVMES